MMAKCPNSPARSASSSNQTDSVLTESTDEESNFIAVLEYKDAFHLLGLHEQSSPEPAEIRAAYKRCKEQTLVALERCEANEKQCQAARGSFRISQTNYLELKLNALDQAINELLPENGLNVGDDTKKSYQQMQQRDVPLPPCQQETVEHQPHRRQVGSPAARPQTQPKEHHLHTQEPRSNNARALTKDVDDLETIDIYFNSSKNSREPKASDQSDAVSILSWDASSIFSMISNAKTNEDAASESGLSDVLGSLSKGKGKNDGKGSVAAPKLSTLRPKPPLRRGINRAITSPRSITDFSPSIHDQGRYKEVGHPMCKKVVTARGRLNRAGPQSTTDAVKQGVMRALHEDDSECVSLDFEDGYPQIASKQLTVRKENRRHETIRSTPYEQKSKCLSQRGGQQQNRGRDDISDNDQGSAASAEDYDVGDRSDIRRTKQAQPMLEEDLYDSLVQSGMDGYNAVLESSMDISNQLCDSLQAFWVDGGNTDVFPRIDESSAADEGSAADDLTGVYTDSTAFNTLSSFSKGSSIGDREDRDKRRLV